MILTFNKRKFILLLFFFLDITGFAYAQTKCLPSDTIILIDHKYGGTCFTLSRKTFLAAKEMNINIPDVEVYSYSFSISGGIGMTDFTLEGNKLNKIKKYIFKGCIITIHDLRIKHLIDKKISPINNRRFKIFII